SVRALAAGDRNVEVTGRVPSVVQYFQRATVAVSPLQCGAGIQNKVLEAMATGTPVVSTSIANRGVRGVGGRHLVVADAADEFAGAVLALLDDAPRREALAEAGRELVTEKYGWHGVLDALLGVYAEVRGARLGPPLTVPFPQLEMMEDR